MNNQEEIIIDGEVVSGTFSSRAPKVKLNPFRLLFRDSILFLIFKILLLFVFVGSVVFAFWSKIAGGVLLVIALLVTVTIWRYISLRRVEFQNAVLCPGIVISQKPPTLLILADMSCGGTKQPIWGVKMEKCTSLKPFRSNVGQRIPCVTAFQGSGYGGSWDQMVSSSLTSGTGDKEKLTEAMSRLDDEEEWQILEFAIQQKRFPEIGKTLKL
jgi:hypothetical protein